MHTSWNASAFTDIHDACLTLYSHAGGTMTGTYMDLSRFWTPRRHS